jgi:tripartite-type tricarboxylate transporter receptor subunit TctC
MQGVGGLRAANYLASQGAQDGSMMGMVSQTAALEQVLQNPAVRYDSNKFIWIGRLTSAVEASIAWHTSPTKTIEDAMKRQTITAASGALGTADTNPRLMNNLAGTRFKLVTGYAGAAATMLAMEQGEVEVGYNGLQTLLVTKPNWLRDKMVNVLVQYSQVRHQKFPDVPTMVEFGKTPEDKQILGLYASTGEIGRSLFMPAGVPPARVKEIGAAFDAMVQDPAFRADAEAQQMEVQPLTGEELQKRIADSLDISPAIAAQAAAAREH